MCKLGCGVVMVSVKAQKYMAWVNIQDKRKRMVGTSVEGRKK